MPETVRTLMRLQPHLQHAGRLRAKLLELSHQLELTTHILDRFTYPLLVMSGNRRVVQSNRRGEDWLALPGNPLAMGASDAKQVGTMLQHACGLIGPSRAYSIQLCKPDGTFYYLSAIPLPAHATLEWQYRGAMALVLVNDPALEKAPEGEMLAQLFRLTPAENRLITPLLHGSSLQEAVAQLNITIATGRSQLKSIFGKLGIRRQSELHRMLGAMRIIE